jgi:hypothetical protein
MTPDQISQLVASEGMTYVKSLVKICICVSMIMPLIGIVFAIIGVVGTRKTQSRWKTAAYVGLGLSILYLVFFGVVSRLGPHNGI